MFPITNHVGEVYEPFKTHFLEKEIRGLAPDEVLVKVRASAICGSDLHIARGAASLRAPARDHRP